MLATPIGAFAESPQPRIALIIANSEYAASKDRLSGPFQDAVELQGALRSLGFVGVDGSQSPSVFTNLRNEQMKEKIISFRKSLEEAGPLAVGFIYYAGHGGADNAGTDNFLLPVDVPDIATVDVGKAGLPVRGFIRKQLEKIDSHPKLMIVIDACRTTGGEKGPVRGNAAAESSATKLRIQAPDVKQPAGMLMALSTGENQTASDSGEFAKTLAEKLKTPGLNLVGVFEEVKLAMARQTGNRQIPVYQSQIIEPLCLAGCYAPLPIDPMVALTSAMQNRPLADTGQIAAAERLNSGGKSLAGLDLEGLHFSGAKLAGVDLRRAELGLADFDDAVLTDAKLGDAMFIFANLKGLKAAGADATQTRFYFSNGEHADFSKVRAERSNWQASTLRGAIFRGANLQGASFLNADVRDADFSGADLRGAFFIGAAIAGAHFEKAQLDEADFSGAMGSTDQFSTEQRPHLCGTDVLRNDPYRYTIRSVDIKAQVGYRYPDFLHDSVPIRSGLKYLRPCSSRIHSAGNSPIWGSQKYDVIGEELTLDFPLELLQSGGRGERLSETFKSLLSTIKSEAEAGKFVTVPTRRSAELLAVLHHNVNNAKLISEPVLDSDAVFMYRARYQPESISSETWGHKASEWAYRADPTLKRESVGNVWPAFFPPDTRPNELNDGHVDAFRQWTLERAKQFPTKIAVTLSSQGVEGVMSNMQNSEFDQTHTDFESILPLVIFAKEHPVRSPELAAAGLNLTNSLLLSDTAIRVKNPLASMVLKIPRTKAPTTRKERPPVRAIMQVTGASFYPSPKGNLLVIDADFTAVQIQYADGSVESASNAK